MNVLDDPGLAEDDTFTIRIYSTGDRRPLGFVKARRVHAGGACEDEGECGHFEDGDNVVARLEGRAVLFARACHEGGRVKLHCYSPQWIYYAPAASVYGVIEEVTRDEEAAADE